MVEEYIQKDKEALSQKIEAEASEQGSLGADNNTTRSEQEMKAKVAAMFSPFKSVISSIGRHLKELTNFFRGNESKTLKVLSKALGKFLGVLEGAGSFAKKYTLMVVGKASSFFSAITGNIYRSGFSDKIRINKALWFFIASGFVVLFLTHGVYFVAHSMSKSRAPNVYKNLIKINGFQGELNKLQDQLRTTTQMNSKQKMAIEENLQKLSNKLSIVSKGGSVTERKQIEVLKETIQSTDIGLYQKISALNREVSQLKGIVSPAPTLDQKVLPFTVQDVDTWNGKPYAQVAQKNNSTMVSYVGLDQRAGLWKVIEIDAPEQSVTFVNSLGQVVHVQVKQF